MNKPDDLLLKKIEYLKGIGSWYGKLFHQKEIFTLQDLLFFFPARYEDRSRILTIAECWQETTAGENFISTFVAECTGQSSILFKGKLVPKFIFSDRSRAVELAAFNPAHSRFKVGSTYLISGKLKSRMHSLQINLLDAEELDDEPGSSLNLGRIVPVYHSTKGLPQKKIRQCAAQALSSASDLSWNLPELLQERYSLPGKKKAVYSMHFPESFEEINTARGHLAYEEFFPCMLESVKKRISERIGKETGRYKKETLAGLLAERLPFKLTAAQERCISEIKKDMFSDFAMNRMLQGDVGCGKTAVIMISSLYAAEAQKQTALLAPTDILARQHYQVFSRYLAPFGINIVLYTASISKDAKEAAVQNIRTGEAKIIIGTHALLQDSVEFFNLSYVIIDEQHRFGVEQRESLRKKGEAVDYLNMSATPIPRSLSLAVFGNLDMSVIDELPEGRKEIKTRAISEKERGHAYDFLLDRIKKGEQGYIVFPVIEETEKSDLRAVTAEYKKLSTGKLNGIKCALLHGRIPSLERDRIMQAFTEGEIKALFTTTVIEVGLDNPAATVMIIESAERFGLAQLHQLRGRVGRGGNQGFSYLIVQGNLTDQAAKRLEIMCRTNDGFKISEADLGIRGPGEFLGSRQSGIPEFKIGNIMRDFTILQKAHRDAEEYVANYA